MRRILIFGLGLVSLLCASAPARAVGNPPSVTLSSPEDGASWGDIANLVVEATASDLDGDLTSVDFYIDGELSGTAYQRTPHSVNTYRAALAPRPSPGPHLLTARANDSAGNVTISAPRTLNVAPPPLPDVVTGAAIPTSKGAILLGTVNEHNLYVSWREWHFEFGLTDQYGMNSGSIQVLPTGALGETPVTASILGLHPNTTYHYRLVASNSFGIGYGLDATFTTLAKDETVSELKNLKTLRPGSYPYSMRLGPDGYFYGIVQGDTASSNQLHDYIYRLSKTGAFSILHTFPKAIGDSDSPASANVPYDFVISTDGTLFGVTMGGGAYGWGTIFSLTPTGVYEDLYQIPSPSTYKLHFVDDQGIIYGSSHVWSDSAEIFTLTSNGEFTPVPVQLPPGMRPLSEVTTLLRGGDGHLYGTNTDKRIIDNTFNGVFRIEDNGQLSVVARFEGVGYNYGGMFEDRDGSFVVFGFRPARVRTSGEVTLLKSFDRFEDGIDPTTLALRDDGDYYGVTAGGGFMTSNGSSYGTIFKLTPTGEFTVLKRLETYLAPGWTQVADGHDGRLYTISAYRATVAFRNGQPADEERSLATRTQTSVRTRNSDEEHRNAPPIALCDIRFMPRTTTTLRVLANDRDPDHGILRIIKVGTPRHGSVKISSDRRALIYAPGAEPTTDTFTYTVDDGQGGEATAQVLLRRDTAGLFTTTLKRGSERTPFGSLAIKFDARGHYVADLNLGSRSTAYRGELNLDDKGLAIFYLADGGTALARFSVGNGFPRTLEGVFELDGESIPFTANFEISF
jgi:uncharacterized repeat protein (TIGR03803 family)